MARTLIGNIKGKDGRGIASISKTGTTGSVDTYTIKYTDGTTSTYTVNNSDSVSLQRQIVPSAAVESSATASQAYAAGDYAVVNGILRKAKSAIAKGNAISNSNSTATTVTGELATLGESVSLEQYKSNGVTACKSGRVVVVSIADSYSISDAWGRTELCTLPWKPLQETSAAPGLQDGGAGVIVQVSTDGVVRLVGKNSSWSSGWLFANLVYVTQE